MQILINGLLQGLMFGSVGVAFALVYRATKVFYLALGGIYALAPFILLASMQAGVHVVVGCLIAVGMAAAIGVLAEESIHWPLTRKGAPGAVHLIGSLGAYLVLVQIVAIVWGNETRVLREGVDSTWGMLGVQVATAQLLGPVLAMTAVALLGVWLFRADHGLELRALADNPILVSIIGCNIRVLRRWVFGLSGALAAVVSVAQAWDVGFDPHVGLKAVLLGMVAMIIGGTGSFMAPFVGGVLLGILRAEVVWFGSARWEEAATFALLAMFLFVKPQGIFANRMRLEEA